jgi:hypothetical protein
MVKFIGLSGLQEEELTKKELEDDFSVSVISQNIESQNDELARKKQMESIMAIQRDQELRQYIGKKWLLKELLRLGEYSENQIREAISGEEGADQELMSEAAKAIEMIERGETPKLNRGANTAFIRKIAIYATDNAEDDLIYAKLMNYALDHMLIAEQNANILSSITSERNQQPIMSLQIQPRIREKELTEVGI